MELHWLSPPEWHALVERAGLEVEALYGWFDRRPWDGGEDMVFVTRASTRVRPGRDLDPRDRGVSSWSRSCSSPCTTGSSSSETGSTTRGRRSRSSSSGAGISSPTSSSRSRATPRTSAGPSRPLRRREPARNTRNPAEAAQAEGILGAALGRLFAVAEAYPGAPGRRELPPAPDRARRDGEPGRRQPPGLQRHRAHVQQHGAVVPGPGRRRTVRLLDREFFDVEDEARGTAVELPVVAGSRSRSQSPRRPEIRSPALSARAKIPDSVPFAAAIVSAPHRLPRSPQFLPSRAARADSFSLLQADVAVDVQTDGSLGVSERLEVGVLGRLLLRLSRHPAPRGRVTRERRRGRARRAFARGNATSLEPGQPARSASSDAATRCGSSGTSTRATDARFTVSYTLRGVAVAYDDVVDVNLKVWGDQWEQPLFRLVGIERRRERSSAPGVSPSGCVATSSSLARAPRCGGQRPGRAVRRAATLFPRAAFTSTAGMQRRARQGPRPDR